MVRASFFQMEIQKIIFDTITGRRVEIKDI
jgi:hypothetical protein